MSFQIVQQHFAEVAPKYRDLRTTDLEPISHIVSQLRGVSRIKAADIGCGVGRYDLELFHALGHRIEHLYCLDATRRMLEQLGDHLARHRIRNFDVVRTLAHNLPFGPRHLNCILTFNAIHHFHVPEFLSEASRVLKRKGHLFIYTRLRSQNRRNIWGRYFPLFCVKETRLFEFDEIARFVDATMGLGIEEDRIFRYKRASTLKRLLELVEHRHYSTFAQYSKDELQSSLAGFEKNITRNFPDPENVEWIDENILFTIRKH